MSKWLTILTITMISLFLGSVVSVKANDTIEWQKMYRKHVQLDNNNYTLYDIDKNGVPELIINHFGQNFTFSIYTIKDNTLSNVYTVDGQKQQNESNSKFFHIVNQGISFFAPFNDEEGLYYVNNYVKDITATQEKLHTDIYKITFEKGEYTTEKNYSIERKIIESQGKSIVDENYFIKGQTVNKDVFLLAFPLGGRLEFLEPHEVKINGWGPQLGHIPQYMMNTLFNRYEISSKSHVSTVEHPSLSNPSIKVSSYYPYVPPFTGITQESITVSYQTGMVDMFIYENEDYVAPINLLMVNGNFIPANVIVQSDQTIYLPLRRVCEQLGYDVEWTQEGTIISDNEKTLDKLAPSDEKNSLIVDGRIYVPMEYFQKINYDVQLTSKFHNQKFNENNEAECRIISIEKIFDKAFTIPAQEAANRLWDALQESNLFTSSITEVNGYPIESLAEADKIRMHDLIKGFIYEDIVNSGVLGRYYIFTLKDGKYYVIMNKYTCEIYHIYFGITLEIVKGL